jgi:glycosyltransferase involved in cell wall biosynthesis
MCERSRNSAGVSLRRPRARHELVSRGVPSSKVATWQPGVDSAFFSPAKRSAALRERWGVSDERPAIVYVGTLSREHGAQRLLSLELGLHRSHPMHRLIVIGDGPSRAEMQLRCSQAVFMGHLTRPALAEALASADLFAWPSEASSTALAVLEAQASGLPVVLMDRGSGRERVSDASAIACRSESDFIIASAGLVRTATRRRAMAHDARCHAIAQRWEDGLVPLIAEYHRAAAAYVTRSLRSGHAPIAAG